MLKTIYRYSLISIIAFLFTLYVQSYAQWERTNFPSDAKVNTIAVKDDNILAGTDGDGIFVSTNNGEDWHSINEGLQSKIIHTIFIYGTTIFAGTDLGVSISTNSGFTWNTINPGSSGNGVWSFAVYESGSGDTTLFAGTWDGIYSSIDNGNNWKPTGLSTTQMPVHSIIVNKNDIFAATFAGGIFISKDDGLTWGDVSIKKLDLATGYKTIVPAYSLTVINEITIAAAGAGTGNLCYYSPITESFFIDTSFTKVYGPLLCFAVRDTNLFAGDIKGNIFSFSMYRNLWISLTSSLKGNAIYSLGLDSSYIFAGTGSGIWRLGYTEKNTHARNIDKASTGFALEQNYPNPFNSSTKIRFTIPHSGRVSLKVYNMLGELVSDLIDENLTTGTYEKAFSPAGLPSGIYFYSLVSDEVNFTKKLILLK